MSEMVERVAKAIAEADGDHTVMDHHRRRSRAAIEAMREPTEEMKLAPPDVNFSPSEAEYVWQAMIDAALGNK